MRPWLQTYLCNGFINLLIRRPYIEMRMWNCEIPKALWWEKKWQLNPLDLSLSPLKRTASTCRVINVQMCVCVWPTHTHTHTSPAPPPPFISDYYTIPIFFPSSLSLSIRMQPFLMEILITESKLVLNSKSIKAKVIRSLYRNAKPPLCHLKASFVFG